MSQYLLQKYDDTDLNAYIKSVSLALDVDIKIVESVAKLGFIELSICDTQYNRLQALTEGDGYDPIQAVFSYLFAEKDSNGKFYQFTDDELDLKHKCLEKINNIGIDNYFVEVSNRLWKYEYYVHKVYYNFISLFDKAYKKMLVDSKIILAQKLSIENKELKELIVSLKLHVEKLETENINLKNLLHQHKIIF